jgi:hypothetical protein
MCLGDPDFKCAVSGLPAESTGRSAAELKKVSDSRIRRSCIISSLLNRRAYFEWRIECLKAEVTTSNLMCSRLLAQVARPTISCR